MQEVYDFVKSCGTYFLATVDGDQPRVRPFGTFDLFDGGLYIQTGKVKEVSKQMHANPKVEICAFGKGKWIRIEAKAIEDERLEAQQHMIDGHPSIAGMYKAGDGNCEVFRLTEGTATISAFGAEPKVIKF